MPNPRIQAMIRTYDLEDIQKPEFRRQLRLAHDEGLLASILRDTGLPYVLREPESRSAPLPPRAYVAVGLRFLNIYARGPGPATRRNVAVGLRFLNIYAVEQVSSCRLVVAVGLRFLNIYARCCLNPLSSKGFEASSGPRNGV